MLSPQALVKGLVSRVLPAYNTDNANLDVAQRLDSYGGCFTQPAVRKSHVLADEGTYYLCTNNQTGIVPTYGTAFAAANPFITIYNSGTLKVALDYAALVAIAAGASTTTQGYTAMAVLVDNGNRWSSGGTDLTNNIVAPNMAAPSALPPITIKCGAITATSATANVRTLVGIRNIRPALSATVVNVIGDTWFLNFGGVEAAMNGSISITAGVSNLIPVPLPPVIIAPNSTALIYLWFPVMTSPSAATYAPELGFWIR